jgi:hypothetical protein
MRKSVICLILLILINFGCLEKSVSPTSTTPQPSTTQPATAPIDYSIVLVAQHDAGSTIDANILVQKDATKEEVQRLLSYFKDVEFKEYISVTIIVYNDMTSAQTPTSEFNPKDPNLVGQLNKYSRAKGELKEGKIIIY